MNIFKYIWEEGKKKGRELKRKRNEKALKN